MAVRPQRPDAAGKRKERKMAAVAELIRAEADGTLSFGNHLLASREKLDGFEYRGDPYKIKTCRELTRLERNGMLVYESVPGTSVAHFAEEEAGVYFTVEGGADVQLTLGLEEDAEYSVRINGREMGRMRTSLGGKLSISVELSGPEEAKVEIER